MKINILSIWKLNIGLNWSESLLQSIVMTLRGVKPDIINQWEEGNFQTDQSEAKVCKWDRLVQFAADFMTEAGH